MLAILVCHCAGAEDKARKTLKAAGVKRYISTRCYTGKIAGKLFLESLPETLRAQTDWKGALEVVESSSNYAIILGYNDQFILWDDVKKGDLMSQIRAEKIAEIFA